MERTINIGYFCLLFNPYAVIYLYVYFFSNKIFLYYAIKYDSLNKTNPDIAYFKI